MGKLYEINRDIEEALLKLDGDENGEIQNFNEICSEIEALQVEKGKILEWVAKEYLNTNAEADNLKTEIDRLTGRKSKIENRAERLLQLLVRETGGQKTDLGVATLYTRKSTSLVLDDTAVAIIKELYPDCVEVVTTDKVDKKAVKDLIKSGEVIDGAELIENINYSVR